MWLALPNGLLDVSRAVADLTSREFVVLPACAFACLLSDMTKNHGRKQAGRVKQWKGG